MHNEPDCPKYYSVLTFLPPNHPGSGLQHTAHQPAEGTQVPAWICWFDRTSRIFEIARKAADVYLDWEKVDPAIARAEALSFVVENSPVTIEADCLFLGGENPFFFNLMLPALSEDRFSKYRELPVEEQAGKLRSARVYTSPCFDGHITPGLEQILALGVRAYRARIEEALKLKRASGNITRDQEAFYEAALISCEALTRFAQRYRQAALELAQSSTDPSQAKELLEAAAVLERIPENPAHTLREALQSYWLAYILVTLEMGGCTPGGGLGLGRMDQYLYPYFRRDMDSGRLDRWQALEYLEQFLLCFCHVDYFTWHQLYTPGGPRPAWEG